MSARNLRTVKQIATEYVWITEPMLRWWIHKREENGFDRLLFRVGGRKWLIDQVAFEDWIEAGRLVAANDND
jgi:hypothetical protein